MALHHMKNEASDPPTASYSPRAALAADFERYVKSFSALYPRWRAKLHAATQYSFIALAVYRFGQWVRSIRPRLLALPLLVLYHVLAFFVHVLFGIDLSSNARIGPGLYIAHFGGIIVCGSLGSHCSIGQGVTIGAKGAGRSTGFPRIGDRVYVGAGAMVIGDVRVGNDVIIGANTVVVQDIPDGARVVSAAVRILPPHGQTGADEAGRVQDRLHASASHAAHNEHEHCQPPARVAKPGNAPAARLKTL